MTKIILEGKVDRQYARPTGYDKRIINLLKLSPKPLSASTIAFTLDIEHTRVLKKLRLLEKFSVVELVTSKKVYFWRLK